MAERRPERAEASFRAALRSRPQAPDLHVNLALALRAQGQSVAAAHALRTALMLQPRHALALRTLAQLCLADRRWDEAEALLRQRLALEPDNAPAYSELGDLLRQQERRAPALELYEAAHARWPDDIGFLRCLANYLVAERQLDRAAILWARALASHPEDPQSHEDQARFLLMLDRPYESLAACERSLSLDSDRASAHVQRGNVLLSLCDLDGATAAYHEALRLDPTILSAQFGLGMLYLSQGRFEEGLPRYELRLLMADKRDLGRPRWQGEPLDGRTVLLQGEQGFGDTIQFARYAPLLARAGRVLLVVQPALDRLMRTMPGDVEIYSGDAKLPHFDVRCPLLSLPFAFHTSVATIPGETPYLSAPSDRVAFFQARFRALAGLRVGLVWGGTPDYAGAPQRSIPASLLHPLLAVAGVSFVSLQPGGRTLDGVLDLSPDLGNFADAAAAMMALDLIVSVDTAAAHLAGALARPVWLLNRADTDWRWLRDRDTTPWYPTMRIWRQPARDAWPVVIDAVAAALATMAAER